MGTGAGVVDGEWAQQSFPLRAPVRREVAFPLGNMIDGRQGAGGSTSASNRAAQPAPARSGTTNRTPLASAAHRCSR